MSRSARSIHIILLSFQYLVTSLFVTSTLFHKVAKFHLTSGLILLKKMLSIMVKFNTFRLTHTEPLKCLIPNEYLIIYTCHVVMANLTS